MLCCLKQLPFSSVHEEQTQMGSDISVPAVVSDKKKEGTSNQSAREESLQKKILVLEPLGIVTLPTIIRKQGGFLFCARAGRRVKNIFCDISQSWGLNCYPHSIPHMYDLVDVTKHIITATAIGTG